MATATPILELSLFLLLISGSAGTAPSKTRLVFYFSEVLYDGKHANRTIVAGENHLGDDMVAFDDPIVVNVHSTPVRRAQSFSFYGKREKFTVWLGFSFCSTTPVELGESFNFCGADSLIASNFDDSQISG